MRKYLIAAFAATVFSSPALAQDQGGYFGVEGGVLFPRTSSVSGKIVDSTGATVVQADNLAGIKYKTGADIDLIGGYSFGMFRLEGEVGYKKANLDRLVVDAATLTAISNYLDTPVSESDLQLVGHARVFSGMVNGLFQFGGPRFGAYAGAGVGVADVKFSGGGGSASDSKIAWQLLAGLSTPISDTIDFGVKYRYFRTGRLKFSETVAVNDTSYTGSLSGRFSSHSLLASLIYHFRSPIVPAPAPVAYPVAPQPPAAQTCPDGSVIPVTTTCPPPPGPPPPPAPAPRPERG